MQEYRQGTVVLTSGDTLRGPLKLYLDRDVLLVTMPDSTVRTVAAVAVRTFAVRGAVLPYGTSLPSARTALPARVRRFRQGPLRARPFLVYHWNHDKASDYTSPAFFERLNGGPVVLLRRRFLVRRSVSQSDAYGYPATYYRPRVPAPRISYLDVSDWYYLGTPEGQVVALRRPRRDLLGYFQAEAAQLEAYAEEHKLSFDADHDLARLVDYANALRQGPAQ